MSLDILSANPGAGTAPAESNIHYPESDGKPMADNTLQWDWMVKIVGELRAQYAGQTVFVAGDLFWYPVQGQPKTVVAPDALVAFGRPAGYRGSYKQWEEGGVAPQVVFEVLSPQNDDDEMDDKLTFYDTHGVEEYYVIDPYDGLVTGYRRRRGKLSQVMKMNGYVSPRLGCKFEMTGDGLVLFTPDGRPFQTREDREAELLDELRQTTLDMETERRRAHAEKLRADDERARAEAEKARAEAEKARADALAAKLRALGVELDG